jgi:hypothetical protein
MPSVASASIVIEWKHCSLEDKMKKIVERIAGQRPHGRERLRGNSSFSSAGNVRQQAFPQAAKQKCQTHHGADVALARVERE